MEKSQKLQTDPNKSTVEWIHLIQYSSHYNFMLRYNEFKIYIKDPGRGI